MRKAFYVVFFLLTGIYADAQDAHALNPLLFADVPDMSMIRVGNRYFMSSTTMHMSPGVPVMMSEDLVNWRLVNYAYDILDDVDEMNLANGKSAYGRGTWASCLRYNQGLYYLSTFSQTTEKTYIFSTRDIENGPWKVTSFQPSYHDHTVFFDDDGKIYMIWGAGRLKIVELKKDLSGVLEGTERVLIENASAPAGPIVGLPSEGSQLFRVNGKYYLFNITWPKGGMRTVIVHRADNITGPYEGKVVLEDRGIAQGGLIDTPEGDWYAYLFRDYGSVGRIPYLVPVKWEEEWPVLGTDGKVPDTLDLPPGKGMIPGIVASDEFMRKKGQRPLPLVWQWNHHPDQDHWSVTRREGYLRLTTGRIDTSFLSARNTITQRTIGPVCAGSTMIDVSGMKEGDFAGLTLLQKKCGLLGVRFKNGRKFITMELARSGRQGLSEMVPLAQDTVFLKAECDFSDRKDEAYFYYSLNGTSWTAIGSTLQMEYTLPHFMGYRFGLFNYATRETGGYVDFDFFRIQDQLTSSNTLFKGILNSCY